MGIVSFIAMVNITAKHQHGVDDQIWRNTVISDISNQVGYFHRILGPCTGSRPDISDLGWTYLMYQTYPASGRVPEPWHGLHVGYIRPRADISDASDIFDHRSGSRTVAAGSGRVYPIFIGYIRLDQN
jgi:hypothetical protein